MLLAALWQPTALAQGARVAAGGERGFATPSSGPDALVSPRATHGVRLVVIGGLIEPAKLLAAVGEPLRDDAVTTETKQRFEAAEFLDPAQRGGAEIEIWVDASAAPRVHLYFVDQRDVRYSLHTLELSGTMSELDLETLAQAISWSLSALRSNTGNTLDAAEAAKVLSLRQETSPVTGVQTQPPRATAQLASSSDTNAGTSESAVGGGGRWSALVSYAAALHSSQFGIVHGPGVGAGFEAEPRATAWGGRLTVQLQLPDAYVEQRVATALTSVAARAGAQISVPLSGALRWGVNGGVGLDTAWVTPTRGSDVTYSAAEQTVSFVPLAHVSVLADIRVATFLSFEVSAGVEADFIKLHYDVVDADAAQSVVVRFPVRPVIALTARLP
jgi:hypothetical protein